MERRREATRARRGSLSIDIDKLTDENEVRVASSVLQALNT